MLKVLEEIPNISINYTCLAKVLNDIGIDCDRKTVSRNVKYLIEFGCPIKIGSNGVCYLKKNNEYKKLLDDVKFY